MKRMIIADDNRSLARALQRYFRLSGFEVETAEDGKGLTSLLSENHIDVAIVDLQMPDMNGLTAIKKIQESSPGARIILMSGDLDEDSLSQAKRMGVADCLMKPFDLQAIDSCVQKAVQETEMP